MIKAIIFDMDGVLVDACDWHFDTLNEALKRNNFPTISKEEHDARFNGLPTKVKLEMLNIPQEDRPKINELKQVLTIEKFRNIEYNHGMWMLFSRLSDNYKIGLYSNAVYNTVKTALNRLNISHFFDSVVTNSDVQHPKPNSEGYIISMLNMRSYPDETIIVEDSDNGYMAAINTGAKVIRIKNSTELYDAIKKEGLI